MAARRAIPPEVFIERVLTALAAVARRRVLKRIPSETLRRTLGVAIVPPRAILFLQHYWALYVHDGRGSVRPRSATWLVWFTDPKDDPRLAGGYPVRLSQVRRLTRAQFLDGLRRNREAAARGTKPFMVVRKVSGPARGVPFFERLDLAGEVDRFVAEAFSTLVLQEGFAVVETDTARVQLR